MKLEDHVVSLELAKKLKELGVKQDSLLWWGNVGGDSWSVYHLNKLQSDNVSAFTVAELGDLLWKRNIMYMPVTINKEWCGVDTRKGCHVPLGSVDDITEADARAKMLIYLLENNLINAKH